MKKLGMLFVLLTTIKPFTNAQYYYKDLVSNKQAQAEKAALNEQKIRTIKVHSFEGDQTPSEGFFCEKKISKDYRRIETYTRSYTTGKALLTTYYNDKGQLLQSTDSSEITVATSRYQYNDQGDITSIISNSHSTDDDFKTVLQEEHQYRYNDKRQPVQMLRIKNLHDSALIDFIIDEHGNVTDEIEAGPNGRHYYYYYDTKNRLTDIVKLNVVIGKLLPDFTFEYNSSNQVTQMVAVEEGLNRNYYTWKYIYNDGLRIIEKCFSKENVLLGYFEYEYD
jgi:YD repeat-containing protein